MQPVPAVVAEERPPVGADVEAVGVAAVDIGALARAPSAEQRGEVGAGHRPRHPDAGQRQDRRPDIVRLGEEAGGVPAAPVVGMDDRERHARERRVQLRGGLARPAVVSQEEAVVGREHDDRVAVQAQPVEAVEEDAEPAVGHRDLGRVERALMRRSRRPRSAIAHVPRHRRVVGLARARGRGSRTGRRGRCTSAGASTARGARRCPPPCRRACCGAPRRAAPRRRGTPARRTSAARGAHSRWRCRGTCASERGSRRPRSTGAASGAPRCSETPRPLPPAWPPVRAKRSKLRRRRP